MTNIPKLGPSDEVRMVDLPLRVYMLPWPDSHRVCRRNINQRGLSRVGVRHPYRDGEPVRAASEVDRDSS